jgi:hypothetical protein
VEGWREVWVYIFRPLSCLQHKKYARCRNHSNFPHVQQFVAVYSLHAVFTVQEGFIFLTCITVIVLSYVCEVCVCV